MFSFHKPKIYRSLKGCCICRAKSSSSRFTDSKRYEMDFEKCFQLYEKRTGEICNACVLLVKRWKKLPLGSTRNWQHVVDARAGPGTKSMMKMKSKNKEENKFKKKHKHRSKHRLTPAKPPCSPAGLSDDILMGDEVLSDNSDNGSGSLSPMPSDCSDDEGSSRRKQDKSRRRKNKPVRFSSFLDLTYWKKTQICCGIIFKGANGEVLVDTSLLRRCKLCKPSSAPSSKADSETSSVPGTPELEEPGPLPLTAPATPQDLMDSCTFPDPPILDRAMPLDLHHSSIMEQEALSEQHQIANAVLDLSLPTSLKNTPDLVPQNRCIAMEV